MIVFIIFIAVVVLLIASLWFVDWYLNTPRYTAKQMAKMEAEKQKTDDLYYKYMRKYMKGNKKC